MNNDSITVFYKSNTSDDRTGYIIVTADSTIENSPDTVEIRQAMPVDLILQNIIVDTGQTEIYKASNSITAAGDNTFFIVESDGATGGIITFDAGNNIYLNAGFDAKNGGKFEANIDTNLRKAEGGSEVINLKSPINDGMLILNINSEDEKHALVQIFNSNEGLIYEKKHNGKESKIDLSSQPKGSYTVKVWCKEKLFVEEVVIN